MSKIIVGVIFIAAIFLAGGFTGHSWCEKRHAKAQTKVLHADAKKSIELEADHVSRTTQTRQIVRMVQTDISACNRADAGDAFFDGMRAKGYPARSPPAP